jgi:hypothetical protein
MTTATSHVIARRWTLAAGLACSLAGWAAAGADGLAGGLVATAIVVAFLTTGLIPIRITQGADVRAGLGLAVLLLTYTLRLALALMALALISRAGFADTRWLGVTIIACALSWSAAHVAHAVRASRREPTVVPEPTAPIRTDDHD